MKINLFHESKVWSYEVSSLTYRGRKYITITIHNIIIQYDRNNNEHVYLWAFLLWVWFHVLLLDFLVVCIWGGVSLFLFCVIAVGMGIFCFFAQKQNMFYQPLCGGQIQCIWYKRRFVTMKIYRLCVLLRAMYSFTLKNHLNTLIILKNLCLISSMRCLFIT